MLWTFLGVSKTICAQSSARGGSGVTNPQVGFGNCARATSTERSVQISPKGMPTGSAARASVANARINVPTAMFEPSLLIISVFSRSELFRTLRGKTLSRSLKPV